MNPRAPIAAVRFGRTPIDDVLDIRGFNLNAILEIEPDFLTDVDHVHDDDVTSFVFRAERDFDAERLEDFLGAILRIYGANLMRYKGVIAMEGSEQRVVLQGVYMLIGTDIGTPWKDGELRESRIVFIGKKLPRDVILQGLEQCLVAKDPKGVSRRGQAACAD